MRVRLHQEPGQVVLPRRVRQGLITMGALGVYLLRAASKDVMFNSEGTWVTVWLLSAGLAWVALFVFVSFSLARWFGHVGSIGSPAAPDRLPVATRQESSWRQT
jgi:hypothetical protein